MGADFVAAWITWPKDKTFDDWKARAKEQIEGLNNWSDLSDTDWVESMTEEEVEQGDVTALKEHLLQTLNEIDLENRDVGGGIIGDQMVLITGGPTWGDSPTESFDAFNLINLAIGTWEEWHDDQG